MCIFFLFSPAHGELEQIFDLVKLLITKDPHKRLTAIQTFEVAHQQLALLYVKKIKCACQI